MSAPKGIIPKLEQHGIVEKIIDQESGIEFVKAAGTARIVVDVAGLFLGKSALCTGGAIFASFFVTGPVGPISVLGAMCIYHAKGAVEGVIKNAVGSKS